jgi:hypothetical protein
MHTLNRTLEELPLASRSVIMLASRPAMIGHRRSGRPLHFLPTAIGPALIPFRDMAVRKCSMYRLNRILEELPLPSRSAVMLASPPTMIARRRSGRPLHLLPTATGPALIPFRDMAVRKCSMYRLNRILEELHLPSTSVIMLASPPAMIAHRRSGRNLHILPTAIGPALIPFRDMAVREDMASRKFMYRLN